MSKYTVKVGEWVTPSETTGSIQNVSKDVTVEVTTSAESNSGLTLSPMQIINFDGTVYVRSAGSKQATFTAVPFKVTAGGGGGGGGTPYTLPTASASIKGGVKIGSGLRMTGEVLSLDGSSSKTKVYDWASSTEYKENQVVYFNNSFFRAKNDHTSSSMFQTDISKWELLHSNLAYWRASSYYPVGVNAIGGSTLYVCKIAHTSGSTFDSTEEANWQEIGGGSSGDAKLTEAVTANTAAGAIAVNEVVAKDTTFTEFVKQLLIAEIAPTTTFTATNSGLVKKGDSVSTVLTLKLNSAGTGTPVSIVFMEGSTVIDTQPYVAGTNTYTYTPSSSITTTTTFKGVLNYTKSDGSSDSLSKSQAFTFVDPIYFGAVNTAPTTEAEIKAVGNETAADKRGRTVTYTLANQKSCYCYPSSLGALTSIKDANNFEYIASYDRTTVSVTTSTGLVSYYVYTLHDPVTITGFKQIFA